MAVRIPPPPVSTEDKSLWNNWYISVQNAIATLAGSLKWTLLDFTGSNLTNILTKSHQVLDNLQGGSSTERYHLTATQASAVATFDTVKWTDLTDGGDTTLHYHAADRARASHTGTQTLTTIGDVTVTAANLNLLDDGVDTTLHFHAADRNSANFTGTNWTDLTDSGTTTLHTHVLTGTANLDFASIASLGTGEVQMLVTGAVVGKPVTLGPPAAIEAGLMWSGYVSAADTVKVRLFNSTAAAIDPVSASWTAAVNI